MAFVSCKQVVAAACDKSLRRAKIITIGRESRSRRRCCLQGGGGVSLPAGGVVVSHMSPSLCHEVSLHGWKTVGAATAGLVLWGREWGKERWKPGCLAGLHPPGSAGSANSTILLPRQSGGLPSLHCKRGSRRKSAVTRERECVVGNQFSPWR